MAAAHKPLGLLLVLAVLAGCASLYPDASQFQERPLSFSGERILGIPLERPARVTYVLDPADDISTMDSCLILEEEIDRWRADHTQGIHCDPESAGGDGDLELSEGRYLIAMDCLADYAERCHVFVTVTVEHR